MVICGSIFIGSGSIFAGHLLSFTELKKIKESKFLYYTAISSIALTFFLFLGVDVYLDLALAWFVGALFGGVLLFEVNRLMALFFFDFTHK